MNWTLNVIVILALTPIMFATVLFQFRIYAKTHYQHIMIWGFVFLSAGLTFLLYALAAIFVSKLLFGIGTLFSVIAGFFKIMSLDLTYRDTVDPIKILIFAILATIDMIIYIIDPTSLIFTDLGNGTWQMTRGSLFILAHSCVILFECVLMGTIAQIVRRNASGEVKKYANIFCISMTLYAIGMPLIVGLALNKFIPGMDAIWYTVGLVGMVFTTSKEPRIFFIQRSKPIRLVVLETQGGIALFSHEWQKPTRDGQEDLFAGMIQGLNSILLESVNAGNAQEIKLENATLVVKRVPKYPLSFVLIANKSSKSLRNGLDIFAAKFVERFQANMKNLHHTGAFAKATELIRESFPFVSSDLQSVTVPDPKKEKD